MSAGHKSHQPRQRSRYTFLDIYNAARTERHFNYVFWLHITLDLLMENAVRSFGYCMVVIATAIITYISYLGFFFVVPAVSEPWSAWRIFNYLWGALMVFSIYFNYFMAITTSPGHPADFSSDNISFSDKICKRCNYPKPERSHHCSICNTCVLKMDHHCPWISNCVGFGNYRYFVSFLIWTTFGTWHVAALSFPRVFSEGSLVFPHGSQPLTERLSDLWNGWEWKDLGIYHRLYQQVVQSREVRREYYNNINNLRGYRKNNSHISNTDQNTVGRKLQTVRNSSTFFSSSVDEQPEYEFLPNTIEGLQPFHFNGNTALNQTSVTKFYSFVRTNLGQFNPEMTVAIRRQLSKYTKYNYPHSLSLSWLFMGEELSLFIAFVMSMGVCIGVGSLMMFHINLIYAGHTTLEYFQSRHIIEDLRKLGRDYRHPYDRGGTKNFEEVFGTGFWLFALLPSCRAPPIIVFSDSFDSLYGDVLVSENSLKATRVDMKDGTPIEEQHSLHHQSDDIIGTNRAIENI